MNNYKQGSAAKGKELFITNYAATLAKSDSYAQFALW
jgi:hypothetical protein